MTLLDTSHTPPCTVVVRQTDKMAGHGSGCLLIALMVACLFVLGGCASGAVDAAHPAVDELEMRFVGSLPCDDCRVIRADLTLHRDAESGQPERFFLHQTHVDASAGNITSTSWGNWLLMPTDEAIYYRLESRPQPIVLRLEDEGQRLGWVGLMEDHGEGDTYELRRAELIR